MGCKPPEHKSWEGLPGLYRFMSLPNDLLAVLALIRASKSFAFR